MDPYIHEFLKIIVCISIGYSSFFAVSHSLSNVRTVEKVDISISILVMILETMVCLSCNLHGQGDSPSRYIQETAL